MLNRAKRWHSKTSRARNLRRMGAPSWTTYVRFGTDRAVNAEESPAALGAAGEILRMRRPAAVSV